MTNVVLSTILAVSIAIERLVELVKPLYIKAKNCITKRHDIEPTQTEKIVITIIIGPVVALVAGALGVQEVSPFANVSPIAQQILIGFIASFGSNVIHPIIGLVAAFKDAAEGLKNKNI